MSLYTKIIENKRNLVDFIQKICKKSEGKGTNGIGFSILKLPIDNKSKFAMEENGQYSLFAEPVTEKKGLLGFSISDGEKA